MLSTKVCIFRLFYWTKVTKFVKVTKILSDIGIYSIYSLLFLVEYLSLRETCPGTYYTVVVEDTKKNKIIASGTLIIEQKFIHETALV